MRIQPHVWAASNPADLATFLPDVVRNAICTHSNPTGLLGAVLHALTLAHTMANGLPPSSDDLLKLVDQAADLMDIVSDAIEVSQYWRAAFEQDSGPFDQAWQRAIAECRYAIELVAATSNEAGADRYNTMLDCLKLRDEEHRGNGTLTAIAAVALTWCEQYAEPALIMAANALGSDTDTIGSMAGAILGATAEHDPPVEVLDADLFRSHAERLSEIASGEKPPAHPYPDLLHWTAPKGRADALGRSTSGDFYVLGLGQAYIQGDPIQAQDPAFMWQWVRLETGQTLLVKRRRDILHIGDKDIPGPITHPLGVRPVATDRPSAEDKLQNVPPRPLWPGQPTEPISDAKFDDMINYVREHSQDDKTIGQAVRRVVNRCTLAQSLVFLGVLADCLQDASSYGTHKTADP